MINIFIKIVSITQRSINKSINNSATIYTSFHRLLKIKKLLFSTVVNCNIYAIDTLVYKIALIIASLIRINAVCVCLTKR